MNDNTTIITHMRTDPNEGKHAAIGVYITQRFQGVANTNRESFMDMLTTWLWPVYYLQKLFGS